MWISNSNHEKWHGVVRIKQMVSSVFILITRIVFCSTNVLSVAALNATTSISARHNIISARTPASYTVTFEAVATEELQECLFVQAAGPSSEWICDRQSHPIHDHVDLAYELPLPGNCAKCRPGNLLVRHGTWEHLWLATNCSFVHSFCRTVVPYSVRVFAVVSVQWAYKPSTSLPLFVVVAERITNHHHSSAHVRGGLDRNATPAFCLFPRMHLCCHIRLTHTFQAVLCTHLYQAIVQWQSCQGTSFAASYRYRIACDWTCTQGPPHLYWGTWSQCNHVHWMRHG